MQTSPAMKECIDEVDWDTIADSLSRCQQPAKHQSSAPSSAIDLTTVTPPFQPQPHRLQPPFMLPSTSKATLTQRDAQNMPATIPKTSNVLPLSSPSPTATTPPPPAGLSTGAKAGIAGASAIGVVIVLATLITLHNRRRRRKYGYTRTKGKDGMISELEGHFTVTTWPSRGEDSPMMLGGRQRSESEGDVVGLGIERSGPSTNPGLTLSGRDGTSVMRHPEYNVSALTQNQHDVSPQIPYSPYQPNLYSPPAQTYHPSPLLHAHRAVEAEAESPDPYEQHNLRTRPSHPLSLLSEAIPPPKLEARAAHSMADYQNAVPLGFANGFVQVGSRRGSEDSIQPTWDLDVGDRGNIQQIEHGLDTAESSLLTNAEQENARLDHDHIQNHEAQEVVRDDEQLPEYEEMAPTEQDDRKREVRESVRWDQSTGHYHIDIESDSEAGEANAERTRRRSLTKEELG